MTSIPNLLLHSLMIMCIINRQPILEIVSVIVYCVSSHYCDITIIRKLTIP